MRDDLVRRAEEFLVILLPLPLDSPLVLVERLGGVETAGGGHAGCVHSEGRGWTETYRADWPVFIPGMSAAPAWSASTEQQVETGLQTVNTGCSLLSSLRLRLKTVISHLNRISF